MFADDMSFLDLLKVLGSHVTKRSRWNGVHREQWEEDAALRLILEGPTAAQALPETGAGNWDRELGTGNLVGTRTWGRELGKAAPGNH